MPILEGGINVVAKQYDNQQCRDILGRVDVLKPQYTYTTTDGVHCIIILERLRSMDSADEIEFPRIYITICYLFYDVGV